MNSRWDWRVRRLGCQCAFFASSRWEQVLSHTLLKFMSPHSTGLVLTNGVQPLKLSLLRDRGRERGRGLCIVLKNVALLQRPVASVA